jgi:hypothetical protein
LGGRDVRPDRVVCWAGSCSPSLLESLRALLDKALSSGLVLAERWETSREWAVAQAGALAKDPPHPPNSRLCNSCLCTRPYPKCPVLATSCPPYVGPPPHDSLQQFNDVVTSDMTSDQRAHLAAQVRSSTARQRHLVLPRGAQGAAAGHVRHAGMAAAAGAGGVRRESNGAPRLAPDVDAREQRVGRRRIGGRQ